MRGALSRVFASPRPEELVKRLVTLALLLLLPATLFAGTEKISPDLLPYTTSTQKVQVIVQYAPGQLPQTQTCSSTLLGPITCVLQPVLNVAGDLLSQIPLLNGVVALVDGTGIIELSNDPSVA